MASHHARAHPVRGRLVLTLVGLACLSAVVLAVGKDKAFYLGGTLTDFPLRRTPIVAWGAVEISGRIDIRSESQLTFDAGRWGSLAIPYERVSALEYGWRAPSRFRVQAYGVDAGSDLQRRGSLIMPWDPFEQFTDKVHFMLTVAYRDGDGRDQAVVFELGNDLVRPTLQALERRTGRTVDFTDVLACTRLRSADECGYGRPSELAGLTRVHLDVRVQGDERARILAEVEARRLAMEWVDTPDEAEAVLTLETGRSFDPRCPCLGGRGEVTVRHGASRRVVLVFTGSKRGVWGTNPATGFGRAFAEAFKAANPDTRH